MQFISVNFFPITIAILSGTMLFWSFFGNRLRGIKEVDCVAALQLINHKNAIVLDVREDDEYRGGHILDARLVPLGKLDEHLPQLEKFKDRPIVVMCRSGARSATACSRLAKHGFAQAYNLAGGVVAWQKANLPLDK